MFKMPETYHLSEFSLDAKKQQSIPNRNKREVNGINQLFTLLDSSLFLFTFQRSSRLIWAVLSVAEQYSDMVANANQVQ